MTTNPEKAPRQISTLLQNYRDNLHWGHFDEAMSQIMYAASLALAAAMREYRQLGEDTSSQHMAKLLQHRIHPHQNRSALQHRAAEINTELQNVLAKNNAAGIRTREEKQQLADAWLDLAASCAKVSVKYEAEQIKQQQKQEKSMTMMMGVM